MSHLFLDARHRRRWSRASTSIAEETHNFCVEIVTER
jgi:hypothetical protein